MSFGFPLRALVKHSSFENRTIFTYFSIKIILNCLTRLYDFTCKIRMFPRAGSPTLTPQVPPNRASSRFPYYFRLRPAAAPTRTACPNPHSMSQLHTSCPPLQRLPQYSLPLRPAEYGRPQVRCGCRFRAPPLRTNRIDMYSELSTKKSLTFLFLYFNPCLRDVFSLVFQCFGLKRHI